MGSGKKIWNVNFVATKRLVEGLMPYMAQGSATILVSSIAGEFGSKFVGIDRMLKRSCKSFFLGSQFILNPAESLPLVTISLPREKSHQKYVS